MVAMSCALNTWLRGRGFITRNLFKLNPGDLKLETCARVALVDVQIISQKTVCHNCYFKTVVNSFDFYPWSQAQPEK